MSDQSALDYLIDSRRYEAGEVECLTTDFWAGVAEIEARIEGGAK